MLLVSALHALANVFGFDLELTNSTLEPLSDRYSFDRRFESLSLNEYVVGGNESG
jgi:hypothetical protein